MSAIRCIACDLDGTIVREDNTLSDNTLQTLRICIHQKILFLPVTGRGYRDMRSALPSDIVKEAVLLNGALYAGDGGEAYLSFPIPFEDIAYAQQVFMQYQAPCIYFGAQHVYGQGNFDKIQKCCEMFYGNDGSTYFSEPLIQVASYREISEPILKMESMHDGMMDTIRLHFADVPWLQISSSMPFNLEITANGVNKAAMLSKVIQRHSIAKEQVLFFGDSSNDSAVFQQFPNTVAVANAADEVKQMAGDLCASCEEDGVAAYLKENVLQKA